jgi:membrane-associated protease RseP (regulator of RpoE activity)
MIAWKKYLSLVALLIVGAPALAQSEAELEEQMRAAEARLEESVRQMRELDSSSQLSGVESVEAERQMYEAERQLAEAAQHIANLSYRRLPDVAGINRVQIIRSNHAVLGVNIGANNDSGPVEGVNISGVSPGGAAAKAGLRSGDVIVSINDQPMSAGNGEEATSKLLEFMQGVEEGDVLNVDYLRNAKIESVQVMPRVMAGRSYSFDAPDFDVHLAPGAPVAPFARSITLIGAAGWGDMEMVPLTEELGRYFGASEGLLVVRAPEDEAYQLQDGDVIQSIGGRTPNSVSHAMRILGSYQSGEELEIAILRDQRKQKLNIDVPDHRTSQHLNFSAPSRAVKVIEVQPAAPPAPPAAVVEQ